MRKRRSKIWLMEDSLFIELFNKANTIKEFVESCGVVDAGGNRGTIINRTVALGLDINILKNKGREHLKRNSGFFKHERKYKSSDIFVEDSAVCRTTIKAYIKKYNIIEQNKCAICGMENKWNDKKLVFVLDHVNGIRNDNRSANLRYLCPNCNSQTDTFAGRNNKKIKNAKICVDCGKIIDRVSTRCRKCASKIRICKYKIRPPMDELMKYIKLSNVKIAMVYNVSETAVRKWKKKYGL